MPYYSFPAIIGKYDMTWLRGQEVKTLASHAGIRGSIPLGVTRKVPENGTFFVFGNRKRGKRLMKYKVLITNIAKEDIKEKKALTVNDKTVRAFSARM